MSSLQACITGGDSGTALIAYDAAASLLHTRTALPPDDDDLMPPKKKGGPLTADEIKKISFWVKQGAAWPEGVIMKPKAKLEVRPPSPDNEELATKLFAEISAKSTEKTASDMKAYTGMSSKSGKPYNMVPIPGGEFLMGSPATEKNRKEDEGPQVKVTIEPFWMGAHEITWDLYMAFMLTPDARWKDGTKKTLNPAEPTVDAVSSPSTKTAVTRNVMEGPSLDVGGVDRAPPQKATLSAALLNRVSAVQPFVHIGRPSIVRSFEVGGHRHSTRVRGSAPRSGLATLTLYTYEIHCREVLLCEGVSKALPAAPALAAVLDPAKYR